MHLPQLFLTFFFFNDTATTEIYTLSLHDALPISFADLFVGSAAAFPSVIDRDVLMRVTWSDLAPSRFGARDRKSTHLNSSHQIISYAVFCLKKKNNTQQCTDDTDGLGRFAHIARA